MKQKAEGVVAAGIFSSNSVVQPERDVGERPRAFEAEGIPPSPSLGDHRVLEHVVVIEVERGGERRTEGESEQRNAGEQYADRHGMIACLFAGRKTAGRRASASQWAACRVY